MIATLAQIVRRLSMFPYPALLCAAVLGTRIAAADADTAFPCAGVPVRVYAPSAGEAAQACEAATRTIRFMRGHKFLTERPLRIRIVERLPSRPHSSDLGQFDARTSEIKVLSYKICQELAVDKPPFKIPMSPALHKSFIVHELAHAIAHDNFEITKPSLGAHEYIAYTVQLAVMETTLREQILDRYTVDAFTDESEITSLYLELSPASFAVKSYKHLMNLPDPTSFYRRLLSGGFVPADVWE
ncbi:MAG: hypothetical protein OES09_08535 [Gammaproteobacteria bacterium]|nr:hypothetical protein [Gammaproteobacteria bacterium]